MPGGGTGFTGGFLGSSGFGAGNVSGTGSRFSANGGRLSNNPVPVGGPTGKPPSPPCPAGGGTTSRWRSSKAAVRSRMWSVAFFDTQCGSGPSPIVTLLYSLIVPFAYSNAASAVL